MRPRVTLAVLAMLLLHVRPACADDAEPPLGDLAVSFGYQSVAPAGWEEFATQQSLGICSALRRPGWPVFIAFDLHAGGKTNREFDSLVGATVSTNSGSHLQLGTGLRAIGYPGGLVLSVSAGVAYIMGGFGADTLRVGPDGQLPPTTTSTVGPWADASLRLRMGDWYSLGVGARVALAHGTLYGQRLDLGGWQVYFTFLGVTWPVHEHPIREDEPD